MFLASAAQVRSSQLASSRILGPVAVNPAASRAANHSAAIAELQIPFATTPRLVTTLHSSCHHAIGTPDLDPTLSYACVSPPVAGLAGFAPLY